MGLYIFLGQFFVFFCVAYNVIHYSMKIYKIAREHTYVLNNFLKINKLAALNFARNRAPWSPDMKRHSPGETPICDPCIFFLFIFSYLFYLFVFLVYFN